MYEFKIFFLIDVPGESYACLRFPLATGPWIQAGYHYMHVCACTTHTHTHTHTHTLRCCSQHLVSRATDTEHRGSISSGGMLQSKLWAEKKKNLYNTCLSCHNKEANLPANHLTCRPLIRKCILCIL